MTCAFAVQAKRRTAVMPNVSTLEEQGIRNAEAIVWYGMSAPAKTPRPIINRLNAEITKALQSPEVKEKLAQQGAEPLGSTPEEYGAYVKKELARWAAVVKATGVTLE